MSDLQKYLLDPKLKRRLRFLCRKFGKQQYFEDIYHDYVVHILEGRGQHQTLDQFFIDHSRKKKWCQRDTVKTPLPKFVSHDQHDFLKGKSKTEDPFKLEPLEALKGSERALAFLYFKYGMNQKELGELYQVSESRISQVLKDIKRRLYGV